MRRLIVSCLSAISIALATQPAQAQSGYGVQTLASERSCGGVGDTAECPGSSLLRPFATDGGVGSTSAASGYYEDRNIPQQGSMGSGAGEFDGSSLFPELHALSYAAENDARVNGSAEAFTTLVYSGDVASPFSLTGTLTVDNSVESPPNPLLPGGSFAALYLAIYDQAAFSNFVDAVSGFFNVPYAAECGQSGLLGFVYSEITAPGGSFGLSGTTSSCGSDPLMLQPGQSIVAYSNLSLFTNRGGFLDASNTLATELDPALGQETIAYLQAHLSSAGQDAAAVPEPSSWAMMLLGFGAIGFAQRRRRTRPELSPERRAAPLLSPQRSVADY